LHAPIGDDLTLALREFVVNSQIPNLNLNPSFDHNLCISSLNGQYEGTLDIYNSKKFQWYLGGFIWCLLTLSTKALNIMDFHMSVIPKVGVHLGVIRLNPLCFSMTFFNVYINHVWGCINIKFSLSLKSLVALIVDGSFFHIKEYFFLKI
jgi:hypothetical protein